MRNIMLDLETMGTSPGCVILSIGAVEFTDHIVGEFHAHIDVKSSTDAGLLLEAPTVMWWLGQSKEAQQSLLDADTVSLHDALEAFVDTFDWGNTRVWANGASFDFPIIKAAFEAVGGNIPWAYYNEMDHRTLKNLVGKDVYKKLQVKPNLAHDALSDARAQALTAIDIMAWINGGDSAERLVA